ncbi:MAG: hypothetical protein NWS20_02975, partial [Rickettsiaceae bacterium]|nr:hypothetical protein [Rickettsiaceae bacterium]
MIDNKIDDNYSITVYVGSILIAYLIAGTFEYFTITDADSALALIVSNVLPMSIFLLILLFSPAYSQKIDLDKYRFFEVIKRMEVEILVGFTIFY